MGNATAGVTMLGNGWRPSSHRSVEVSKHENGFSVDAKFAVLRENRYGQLPAKSWQEEQRRYVFYTVPEVLDFVRGYLEADASTLRREEDEPA